jgi:DNA modification methylase
MKPTDLIVKCLQNSSGFQNGVYDPFVGSGSVVAACEQVGRVAYAIDIDPENIALTLDRMVAMGLTPKLIGQE